MYIMDGRIRYSEVGTDGKLTLMGLVNYFQDCSTFHSEDIGLGQRGLLARNRAWILSAWQIETCRMPELNERIQVVTWPYAFKGFMGLRNYGMLDADGNRIAVANAIWTMLDTVKRCPVRIEPEDTDGYELEEKADMDYAPRKISVGDNGVRQPEICIMKERIDTNGHMNNGQYIGIASEYLPAGVCVHRVRVEYKKEVYPAQKLVPYVHDIAGGMVVVLSRDGQECAAVEFLWRDEQS